MVLFSFWSAYSACIVVGRLANKPRPAILSPKMGGGFKNFFRNRYIIIAKISGVKNQMIWKTGTHPNFMGKIFLEYPRY
jgi:hypothetical protein